MRTFDNVDDAVDFVDAYVKNNGNVVFDQADNFHFIDCVIVIDDAVVVVSNNRFYTLCIKNGNFYIDREFDEAANDNLFWCNCAA